MANEYHRIPSTDVKVRVTNDLLIMWSRSERVKVKTIVISNLIASIMCHNLLVRVSELLGVTIGARNPNLKVVITHVPHV